MEAEGNQERAAGQFHARWEPGRLAFVGVCINPRKEETMDENRFEGVAKDIGGNIKGAVGDMTGDSKLQAEGTIDQVVGTAQRAYGKVKDTVANNAGGLGSAVVDQLDETSAFLGDTVAERPLTSLLVAGAIGYVLATLMRR